MDTKQNVFFCLKFFLLISIICACNCEDDGGTKPKSNRPKYTTLVRSQKVTSTSTTSTTSVRPETLDEEDKEKESSEEVDEDKPISNARQPASASDQDQVEEQDQLKYNARQPVSTANTKEYVEFIRPGATPRPRTTTTRAPKKKVDKNSRAEGCNQCRYYCKQCKGSEEVTSGGVWGCCNHNCCGGRCSCQKVM